MVDSRYHWTCGLGKTQAGFGLYGEDQHFRRGELRNVLLLSFEDDQPGYDEAALDRFAGAGQKAWADVPDAGVWVRELSAISA